MPLAESRRIRLMIIVAVTLVVVSFVIQRLLPRQGAILADGMRLEMVRQGIDTTFERRMTELPTDSARQAESFRLARRGIARLTELQLMARLELLVYMDSVATPERCAARLMGTLAPEDFQSMISTLNAEQRERWLAVTVAGIAQELKWGPTRSVPPATGEEVQAAFGEIKRPLSSPDEQRFNSVLQNIQTATAEDKCWASLLISRTTLALPDPPQSFVLVTLGKVEAGL